MKHGLSGYRRHRCRCDECKAAHRSDLARWRAEKAAAPLPVGLPHGVLSTYQNWGCRCEDCRASRQRDRRRRALASHRRLLAGEVQIEHGNRRAYNDFLCRCDVCRAWNTADHRERMGRRAS